MRSFHFMIIPLLVGSTWLAGCSHTDRRLGEIADRANGDLNCEEKVRVVLMNPHVIGAAGCGRKAFYSVVRPAH